MWIDLSDSLQNLDIKAKGHKTNGTENIYLCTCMYIYICIYIYPYLIIYKGNIEVYYNIAYNYQWFYKHTYLRTFHNTINGPLQEVQFKTFICDTIGSRSWLAAELHFPSAMKSLVAQRLNPLWRRWKMIWSSDYLQWFCQSQKKNIVQSL